MANLPARIDFLLYCSFGDFILSRDIKQKLRLVLGEFGNMLTDDSWNGFGVYRSKMETIVSLVVNDALGNSVPSFKEAIGQLDLLSRHYRSSNNETAETYLRSVRWGIMGFQVFKNMDTHGQHGEISLIHEPIVDCAKRYWSTLAYVQMQTIVCCLEWLHEALKAWKAVEAVPKGRAQSPTHHEPVRPPTPVPTFSSPQAALHMMSAPQPPVHAAPSLPPMPPSYFLHQPPPQAAPTVPQSYYHQQPPPQAAPIGTPSYYHQQPPPQAAPIAPPPMSLPVAPTVPPPVSLPAAPSVAPPVAAPRVVKEVAAAVPSPRLPAASMLKLATDVYNELERRQKLQMKPRNYSKCKHTTCKIYNCSYAHTKEELKIIGVSRAIAVGDVWKTVMCHNVKCTYAGCDFLHEDDKKAVIATIKSLALELVDHVRVSENSGDLLVVTFNDGKTVTVKMK